MGNATVSWVAPTMNTDGSPLTNLAGFTIHYGTNNASLTQTIQVANAGAVSYVVTNLPPGTWYFAVSAYTNAGAESALSSIVSKTI
jgi:Fibronectin type III domain